MEVLMQLAKRLFVILAVMITSLALLSCATTAKGRYYENLDMYDFVMTKFIAEYEASTVTEQHQMDKEVLPLLNAWKSARLLWKASIEDAGKEQAAMLAYAEAKAALIQFGIVTVKELEEVQ
jgi:flagellar biosynthesis regulator FlaF